MMKNRRKARLLVDAGIFILAVSCWLYANLIERTWIEETSVNIPCSELQRGATLKFAVLADLHARPNEGAYLDEIVRRTLAARPDAVLLLGDYLNGHETEQGMSPKELLRHLQPLAQAGLPLFAVLGNHDYYHNTTDVRLMLTELGAQIVEGRAGRPTRFEKHGVAIDIGGIRCMCHHRTPGPVPLPREHVPLLLLSHTPVGAEYAAPGTFLVISGHTHGGQVCWPWGKPIYMADGKTPRCYSAGMVAIQDHKTYVSRGLGTSLFPIRLFCRPELTFLTISG